MEAHYSKDPTGDSIEMVANAVPGSYVGFSGANFHQHELAGGWGLSESRLNHELSKFDEHTHNVNHFTFMVSDRTNAQMIMSQICEHIEASESRNE